MAWRPFHPRENPEPSKLATGFPERRPQLKRGRGITRTQSAACLGARQGIAPGSGRRAVWHGHDPSWLIHRASENDRTILPIYFAEADAPRIELQGSTSNWRQ